MGNLRRILFAIIGGVAVLSAAVGTGVTASATPTPAYGVATVGAYGGEPSIVSDHLGQLYDTTPSGSR